jgi:hypothetical protein
MDVAGTIDITVAGERWTPVASLATCGPEDQCYAIDVGRAGAVTVRFGDGASGLRPSPGATIEASFRSGGGATGDVAAGASDDPGIALVEALARVADMLSQYQDQIVSEAFLETGRERISLSSLIDVMDAIAGREDESRICFCLRPVGRPEQRRSE